MTTGKSFIDGSTLKIIAIITMFIDHIGAVILINLLQFSKGNVVMDTNAILYVICRNIGRISFPIFCFLLVEGFIHTKNVTKYAARLLIFAFISEIPFDLATNGDFYAPYSQNVFFTLWIGILVLIGLKKIGAIENMWLLYGGRTLILLLGALASIFLNTDYELFGIISIAVLYLYRYNKKSQILLGACSFLWEPTAILGFLPIYFYNGKRGLNMKYVFYAFYPIHFLVLYLIAYNCIP